jgi:hypothetical protein
MTNNFSIRTNIIHTNAPKRKVPCLYFIGVSRQIKANDGSGDRYTDTYTQCTKTKKRIKRSACINCVMYKSIIYTNGEENTK